MHFSCMRILPGKEEAMCGFIYIVSIQWLLPPAIHLDKQCSTQN